MSSLYDKYYSEHNRTYMYKLINDMILKDYKVNVSNNETYNQFFQTNFINTFNTINTEDIKDLNNHLLTTQLEYFQNLILKQKQLIKVEESDTIGDFIVYSLKRKINLKLSSRHNFRINLPTKIFQIDKIIIPIEDSELFMNPILFVTVDKVSVELHLRGTIKLHNRDHGIYSPFYEKNILVEEDIVRIQFRNQLFNLRDSCDVYKILDNIDNKIIVNANLKEFKEGDYIRINNYENKEEIDTSILKKQYKIVSVHKKDGNIELEVEDNLSDVKGLYIMNLSLQNTIQLISPE
jgi:hypothetical protein